MRLGSRKAAGKRQGLAGVDYYDHEATVAGRPQVVINQYGNWLLCKTGGAWFGRGKQTSYVRQDQTCPECGVGEDSLRHIMKACPAYAHMRCNLHKNNWHSLNEHTARLVV